MKQTGEGDADTGLDKISLQIQIQRGCIVPKLAIAGDSWHANQVRELFPKRK